tara:strand:+ start:2029 stop:2652 length:624 start_codon:yes stop_codon:yes gene_type:complete
MAIDTYTNLKASIASFLNREDLTAQIPDFIALAEAKFNRELRVNAMVAREVTTATSDYVELPGDWLQTISAVITSPANTYSALRYIGPEEYNDLRNDGLTGTARMYTIINSNMLLLPAPQGSVTIEIIYYKKIPALSSSVATNWLLDRSQDLYLYASLIQAEAYLQNDERISLWAAAVERVIADMKLESEREKRPQGALMARRRTFG